MNKQVETYGILLLCMIKGVPFTVFPGKLARNIVHGLEIDHMHTEDPRLNLGLPSFQEV